jgi:hypothetical protein
VRPLIQIQSRGNQAGSVAGKQGPGRGQSRRQPRPRHRHRFAGFRAKVGKVGDNHLRCPAAQAKAFIANVGMSSIPDSIAATYALRYSCQGLTVSYREISVIHQPSGFDPGCTCLPYELERLALDYLFTTHDFSDWMASSEVTSIPAGKLRDRYLEAISSDTSGSSAVLSELAELRTQVVGRQG